MEIYTEQSNVADPVSGSRALGLTEDVWHQKYENKKEGLQNYLEHIIVFQISYIVLGTEPWIRNSAKTGSATLEQSMYYVCSVLLLPSIYHKVAVFATK